MGIFSNIAKRFAPSVTANLPAVHKTAPTPATRTSDALNLSPADRRGREISYVDGSTYGPGPVQYNSDDLVAQKGLAVYRKMARDPALKSALGIKKVATLSAGWEIRPCESAGQSPAEESAAKEQADFLNFCFSEMPGGFSSKLKSVLTALDFGFSVSEMIVDEITYGPHIGKYGLKDLKTRMPDDFSFVSDNRGNLLPDGIVQSGRAMPSNKFLLFSHNSTFSNFFGESDLRASYDSWWLKQNAMRFLFMTLERFGQPIIQFDATGTLTSQQEFMLQRFALDLQQRAAIILPQGISMALREPQRGAGDAFLPSLAFLNDELRVSILVPGLLGVSSEQQVGSLARSSTEFDVFMMIIDQLRDEIETCINERLCKLILDLNFQIETGKYPAFKFKTHTAAKRAAIFNQWLAALGARAVTPRPQDEQRLRSLGDFDQLGADELDDSQDRIERDRTNQSNEQFFNTEAARIAMPTKKAQLTMVRKT